MLQSSLSLFLFIVLFCGQALAQSKENSLGSASQLSWKDAEATKNNETLKTLKSAFKATNFDFTIEGSSNFTIFGPSDEAINSKNSISLETLFEPENRRALYSFVTYHMIAGRLTASSILRAMSSGNGIARFTTVQGNELLASMDGTDIVLMDCFGNKARITSADKKIGNSVLHIIDNVILAN